MATEERPNCDCPEPCACYAEGYAAGKEKAHFEVRRTAAATFCCCWA